MLSLQRAEYELRFNRRRPSWLVIPSEAEGPAVSHLLRKSIHCTRELRVPPLRFTPVGMTSLELNPEPYS